MLGYHPHKPGRPSHTYHTYLMANLRRVLEVEVQDGHQTASNHSAPGLWALLSRLPREHWPVLIRGDKDWGTESNMARAEQQGLHYLFKLRLTKNVKRLLERLMRGNDWVNTGQGWQGADAEVRISGWSHARRVVVLRRPVKRSLAVADQSQPKQLKLSFTELADHVTVYEYAVLVTSLKHERVTLAQLYRDRADGENSFDELKNHWGWGGLTTHDLKRCRFMARTTALIDNWWSLFVRLVKPDQPTEALTSRLLMLYALGKQTQHAGQTHLTISSTHAEADSVEAAFRRIAQFFKTLSATAEHLNTVQRWCRILSLALVKYLHGRQLQPPAWLPAPG